MEFNDPESLLQYNYGSLNEYTPIQWGTTKDYEHFEVWCFSNPEIEGGDGQTVALIEDIYGQWREAEAGEIGEGWDW